MSDQPRFASEPMILSVSRVVDAGRLNDAAYREHVLFDLFVSLHCHHNLQPDVDKPYLITRTVENWDVWVSMRIADVLPAAEPGAKALFLDRRMVETWVSRLKLEPWSEEDQMVVPPRSLLRAMR